MQKNAFVRGFTLSGLSYVLNVPISACMDAILQNAVLQVIHF